MKFSNVVESDRRSLRLIVKIDAIRTDYIRPGPAELRKFGRRWLPFFGIIRISDPADARRCQTPSAKLDGAFSPPCLL
jgi:hypothetical protein